MVAGHAQRRARPRPSITRRTHFGNFGPAIHQVAEEDELASRWPDALQAAAGSAFSVDSPACASNSTSSSKQPCTSPMMSNGPCSCFRLFQSGCRSIVGRVDLLRRSRARRRGGTPRAPARAASAAAAEPAGGSRAGRSRGPAAPRLRSWQTLSGRFKHDGHGQAVILPRQLHQRLARLRLHVGRVDHGQLARGQPLARR